MKTTGFRPLPIGCQSYPGFRNLPFFKFSLRHFVEEKSRDMYDRSQLEHIFAVMVGGGGLYKLESS
jgi:hypothetical protein